MAKRRGRGEGTIVKRADGRWMASADLGWQDGRRQRKAVYGRTRRAVAGKLTRVLRSVQEGAALPDERVTVARFLERWLTHKQTTMRPRSWATYEQAVRLYLAPNLGKLTLARLRPMHVQDWMRELQDQGTSARTIRYARVVFRAALNQARKWEMVSQNVAALVDPPRHTVKEIQPLSPVQARALLDEAKVHRLGGLLSIATALGLRLGEGLGLRWRDVDFEAGTLSVRQAIERSGGDCAARRPLVASRRAIRTQIAAAPKRSAERRQLRAQLEGLRVEWRKVRTGLRTTEPKSARSRRTIHMPAIVVTALKGHRTRQRKERLAAGGAWQNSGLVFTSPIGTALDSRNVSREFHVLLEAAGLPSIRFHDLRHTAATLLLAQGVDPRTIMETLGHSQISLTLNTYSHVLPELQADAAVKMNAILSR
jgi:integrase